MSNDISRTIRWRLSVLWLLEWGITGAILTYLPLYFTENGIRFEELGVLMAVSAVGLWVAPFVVGQICDRWMASDKYLAISHLCGGLLLLAIPFATKMYRETDGGHLTTLTVLLGLYAIAYLPTMPLASSLTFRHLSDPDTQFGKVRIWGTVGWVLSGWLLSMSLGRADVSAWLVEQLPSLQPSIDTLGATFAWIGPPKSSDCFRIAALLSFALSSFCIFLPATPPAKEHEGKLAPIETLKMFHNRTFTMLIGVSFLLAMVVPFYSIAVPKLLQQMGFDSEWIPAVMTIGQISEFPALLLLPWFLKRFGLKTTFAIGMAAWLLRYVLFAMQPSTGLVLAGIGLHGVCHVFLIIVIQLYVDSQCRQDLRASGQNLFAFITMGIAMPAGFWVAGMLGDWVTVETIDATTGHVSQQTDYGLFFAVPAAVIAVLLPAYWRWVRLDEEPKAESGKRDAGR